MPTFLIEREIPGASTLTREELADITAKSNDVVSGLGVPYRWVTSYVAGDKIYCVHETDQAEAVLEHARRGGSRPTWSSPSPNRSTRPSRDASSSDVTTRTAPPATRVEPFAFTNWQTQRSWRTTTCVTARWPSSRRPRPMPDSSSSGPSTARGPPRSDTPRQGSVDGPTFRIEVFEPWVAALEGVERCERIEVLYWLHLSRRDLVRQRPGNNEGDLRGTFALRSPMRPNPIGTSIATLERVDGANVFVRGLDCLDGTPLLDLKPQWNL